MTLRSLRVKSFDGVALHNGSTRFVESRITETERALNQVIRLPSGQKYDATPSTDTAPLVPGAIPAEVTIDESSAAAAQTAFEAIAAKLGVRATLTVEETSSSTTYTATARMTRVQNTTPLPASNDEGYLEMAVEFELLELLA